jgi:hypothetical protein
MHMLSSLFTMIQHSLFPFIEENSGPLSEKEREFVRVAELADVSRHIGAYRRSGRGRKRKDRQSLALAFLAKAVWNLATTRALVEYLKASPTLRRLCGWHSVSEVPSESTFSRSFAQFSKGRLPCRIHESMVVKGFGGRIVGHVSRDATAIEVREKPAGKPKNEVKQTQARKPPLAEAPLLGNKRQVRRKKGEGCPGKQFFRLDMQVGRGLGENIKELPCVCDKGAKRNSRGNFSTWNGYKLHLDVADGDIPISAILTSASTHDSQAAIPLMQMSTGRVTYLYELGDSAYDAKQIVGYSRFLGHVPIVEANKRRKTAIPFSPAQQARFKERSSVERVNSNLKDNYCGRSIRVRGAIKVLTHLMFGVVALTAAQLFNLLE